MARTRADQYADEQRGRTRDPDYNRGDGPRHPQDLGTTRADAHGHKNHGVDAPGNFQSGRRVRRGMEHREWHGERWTPDSRRPGFGHHQLAGTAVDTTDPYTDVSADDLEHDHGLEERRKDVGTKVGGDPTRDPRREPELADIGSLMGLARR